MFSDYRSILCIHPNDESTSFLSEIGKLFGEYYYIIDPGEDNQRQIIEKLSNLKEKSLIIYLGHGSHSGLFGCPIEGQVKSVFINHELAEKLFANHDVVVVACNSAEFMKKQRTFARAVGFGNIISSMAERNQEAEYVTGKYRPIDERDIAIYNECFVYSLIESFKLFLGGIISFDEMLTYLVYFINKKINSVLLDKDVDNRIEIAKLLFETRSDLTHFV